MPNKMERFTQRARHVLQLAQVEAERLQHNYIGTEHLLLGLMQEEGSVGGRVLRDLGLDAKRLTEVIEALTRTVVRTNTVQLDLSPGTKKVLELAVDEARRMGHHYIGTEHLLLGLVRQSEGVAVDALKRLGVSPEEIRRQTRRVLQEAPTPPPSAPPPAPAPVEGENVTTGELEVSPAVAKLLQNAAYEARLARKDELEMEHIFLALIRQYESTIGGVLSILRLSPDEVRQMIKNSGITATPATRSDPGASQAVDDQPGDAPHEPGLTGDESDAQT